MVMHSVTPMRGHHPDLGSCGKGFFPDAELLADGALHSLERDTGEAAVTQHRVQRARRHLGGEGATVE